jgi:[protein-PII] uridylyltransferase
VEAIQAELATRLGWEQSRFARLAWRMPDSYWLAEPLEVLERNAIFMEAADRSPSRTKQLSLTVQKERGGTLLTVYTTDQPGLFYRLAAAISFAGGNIIDARIHTSSDGMALDNFLIQDMGGAPLTDRHQLERLDKAVLGALEGQEPLTARLESKALPLTRAGAFDIRPAVFIDNQASSRYTVIEVNARDRAALLSVLGEALFQSRLTLHSAHIATYGERAVDVFYITDRDGTKIESPTRLRAIQARLLRAAGAAQGAKLKAA